MKRTQVVMYGVGEMGMLIARMLAERGIDIVGAVGRSTVGRTLGDLGDIPGPASAVTVESDIGAVLARTHPDLVVMTTASYMHQVKPGVLACLRAGVNVVSLAEENLYSWVTSPEDTAEIDSVAKEYGVTYSCSGHQEGFFVQLVSTLMGTVHRIEDVHGQALWNVDDYGPELARDQRVGDSVDEFTQWLRESDRPPTFGRIALHVLAAANGLSVIDSSSRTEPVVADRLMHSSSLGIEIPPGNVIGSNHVDVLRTAEGITLTLEMTGRVYEAGEQDNNAWTISGEPSVNLENVAVPTHLTTCGTLVNRVPQIIDAPPGYLTTAELPPLRFTAHL